MSDLAAKNDELIANLKGAFSDHEIIEITVTLTQFNRDPSAKTLPVVKLSEVWALHPSIESFGGWTCTHLPSGYCTGWQDSIDRALMILGALIATGIPWEAITTNADLHRIYEEHPEMKAALKKGLDRVMSFGKQVPS